MGGAGVLLAGCRPGSSTPAEINGDALGPASAIVVGTPANAFLRDMRTAFAGKRLRVLTEDTPPSVACKRLAEEEFSRLTGIEIEWLLLPLEQVHARTRVDTAQQSGHHDIFYIDQSWLGEFSHDLEEIGPLRSRKDLAYPDWNFADFMLPLIRHTASFQGRIVALPYDITLFIGMYRRDLFERLGMSPPSNLTAYLESAREIDRALGNRVRGTTGQLRVGHYALLCHWSAWLWGHGGSFFHADGTPALDDPPALASLEYLLELRSHMPSAAISWDWHGESRSFARGEAAFYSSWGEFFPVYDDPARSAIVGLAEPMPMPAENALRPAAACAFGETPGISHQGGSGIALSRYGKQKEAAWVFLQWLTSADIGVRACLLGGGASATRSSAFTDPRILARADQVGPGTTRHFGVMQDAILRRMGTEPHHPRWPELALTALPVELGRLITGQQSIRATARAMSRVAREVIDGPA
jgi:multiple sugar transport system substrate-binding protein